MYWSMLGHLHLAFVMLYEDAYLQGTSRDIGPVKKLICGRLCHP